MTKTWSIYLLRSERWTYVGATTDITRRIRQHNREIAGGAWATAKAAGTWQVVICITGFKTKREALRWEALVKRRARGITARTAAMKGLLKGVCPKPRSRGSVTYKVPEGLSKWQ